ncbi:hypothetical protein D3C87_1663280 [compost metagenome]
MTPGVVFGQVRHSPARTTARASASSSPDRLDTVEPKYSAILCSTATETPCEVLSSVESTEAAMPTSPATCSRVFPAAWRRLRNLRPTWLSMPLSAAAGPSSSPPASASSASRMAAGLRPRSTRNQEMRFSRARSLSVYCRWPVGERSGTTSPCVSHSRSVEADTPANRAASATL